MAGTEIAAKVRAGTGLRQRPGAGRENNTDG